MPRKRHTPDDEFIKARPDLVTILDSFNNWLQIQSRTSPEGYRLSAEFDPSLMSDKDREFWIFELEKLEISLRCSISVK